MPAFPLICPACTKVITPSNETVKPWGDDGPVLHSECATYIRGTYRELEVAHSTLAPSVIPSVREMADPSVPVAPSPVGRDESVVVERHDSYETLSVSRPFGGDVVLSRTTGGSCAMITLTADEAAEVAAFVLRTQRPGPARLVVQ